MTRGILELWMFMHYAWVSDDWGLPFVLSVLTIG